MNEGKLRAPLANHPPPHIFAHAKVEPCIPSPANKVPESSNWIQKSSTTAIG
jgi:hypothetical protein